MKTEKVYIKSGYIMRWKDPDTGQNRIKCACSVDDLPKKPDGSDYKWHRYKISSLVVYYCNYVDKELEFAIKRDK